MTIQTPTLNTRNTSMVSSNGLLVSSFVTLSEISKNKASKIKK